MALTSLKEWHAVHTNKIKYIKHYKKKGQCVAVTRIDFEIFRIKGPEWVSQYVQVSETTCNSTSN